MDKVERIADMLGLGYTEHEIIRILGIPTNQAEDLIQLAEQLNDQSSVPYSGEYLDELASYYGEE